MRIPVAGLCGWCGEWLQAVCPQFLLQKAFDTPHAVMGGHARVAAIADAG